MVMKMSRRICLDGLPWWLLHSMPRISMAI